METTEVLFDGVKLLVPVINDTPLEFPHPTFEEFPYFCGAGEGWGERLVPDFIDEVPISPCCFVHDFMFDTASPTWTDFHNCNYVFNFNIAAVLRHFSPGGDPSFKRKAMAWTYYEVVDKLGSLVFWNLKKAQNYELPFDIRRFITVYPHTGLSIREIIS